MIRIAYDSTTIALFAGRFEPFVELFCGKLAVALKFMIAPVLLIEPFVAMSQRKGPHFVSMKLRLLIRLCQIVYRVTRQASLEKTCAWTQDHTQC